MNRRTALAIAVATATTLGGGVVTAAAVSGSPVLGLGHDSARIEAVAPATTIDDNSPTSTRGLSIDSRDADEPTSSTSSTSSTSTTTRPADDEAEHASTTTTPSTTGPTGVSPTTDTATFHALGGDIDVAWTTTTVEIVAVRAATGFRAETENEDRNEAEVEFESATHQSKITVRLINGAPSASVEERDEVDDGHGRDDNSNQGKDDRGDDHGGQSGRD